MFRKALVIIASATILGCMSSSPTTTHSIPTRKTAFGLPLSTADKIALIEKAKSDFPNFAVSKIELHSWYHPNDIPVATVHFKPIHLENNVFEFHSNTYLNMNWTNSINMSPSSYFTKNARWYVNEHSFASIKKRQFSYNGNNLFFRVGKTTQNEHVESLLSIIKSQNVFSTDGQEVLSLNPSQFGRVAHEVKNNNVFYEISIYEDYHLTKFIFIAVGESLKLVSQNEIKS